MIFFHALSIRQIPSNNQVVFFLFISELDLRFVSLKYKDLFLLLVSVRYKKVIFY